MVLLRPQTGEKINMWILKAIALIIIFPLFLVAFLAILAGLVIAWALGVPIKIKESGREIGYVRWFTFHRYDHNGLAGPFEITRR
jgi:hypothetical protein